MPIKPLLNPDNAIESALGFKEGLVRVEQSVFKVHQPKSGEGQPQDRNPFLALVWQVTRLDEETKEPMRDDDGNPVTEEVVFSFGATSLAKVHPGMADANGIDPDDLGVEINTEGPTVFIKDKNYWLNTKAGITHLMKSMKEKGTKKEQLDRVWAPDWVGSILYLKSVTAPDKMWRPNKAGVLEEATYSYKVVERIERGPRASAAPEKPKVVVKGKATASAANGKPDSDPEVQIKPLIEQISQEKTGKSMSKKALIAHLITVINDHGLGKQTPNLIGLVQDDKWLEANGPKYDFAFNPADNTIAFS